MPAMGLMGIHSYKFVEQVTMWPEELSDNYTVVGNKETVDVNIDFTHARHFRE